MFRYTKVKFSKQLDTTIRQNIYFRNVDEMIVHMILINGENAAPAYKLYRILFVTAVHFGVFTSTLF